MISQLIAARNWCDAYIISGVICLIAVVIAVLLIKRFPAEYGQRALGEGESSSEGAQSSQKVWLGVDKKKAMKTPACYIACIAMFLTGIDAAGMIKYNGGAAYVMAKEHMTSTS